MNPVGFIFRWIAEIIVNTRFSRLVVNSAYAKFLIIVGGLSWLDLPHLHHPLITLRHMVEWKKERVAMSTTDNDKEVPK